MERTKTGFTRVKKPPVTVLSIVNKIIYTGVQFSPTELHLAEISRINVDTGPYFKSLVRDYFAGIYCGKESELGGKIKTMLHNTASYSKG